MCNRGKGQKVGSIHCTDLATLEEVRGIRTQEPN